MENNNEIDNYRYNFLFSLMICHFVVSSMFILAYRKYKNDERLLCLCLIYFSYTIILYKIFYFKENDF